jgi:thioredoxin 1
MGLRSKLTGILALAAVFFFVLVSADCGNALAQDKTGKTPSSKPSVFRPLVTLVEIGSVSCIPCKAMQPILSAVEEEYKGQVKIAFHDVWTPKGKMDAAKYNIRIIPTQVFLDQDGKEYFRHEGYFPKAEVVRILKMKGVK